ncbi:VOC family protein [Planococcus sp. YIM B11945]|uniref:VOC family protein n=1 Tax=Planococcus sp. YIM B11945 TaxID=3435410 RepID=UPI003D7ED6F6
MCAMQVVPYVMVHDGPGFIAFLEKAFQAEVGTIANSQNGQKIIHGEVKIGDSLIYFADGTDEEKSETKEEERNESGHQMQKEPANIHLFVFVSDVPEVIKRAENAGGTSVMPLMENADGQMGGFVDPFNNLWWVQTRA